MNRARNFAASETGTNLEALGRGDAEHGVGQHGFELVESRLAQAAGNITDDAGNGAANAVVVVPELGDQILHALVGLGIGAADGQVAVDGLAGDGVDELEEFGVGARAGVFGRGREEVLGADRGDEGDNLDTVGELKVLLGDGTGSDAANGLTGRGAAATRRGLDTVFLEVGPVGVGRTGVHVHGLVTVVWKEQQR